MIFLKDEMTIHYDVDDTLIMYEHPDKYLSPNSQQIIDWGKKCVLILDPYDGKYIRVKPHFKHIEILKRHHSQGYSIIVWSAGGALWANSVVKALKLEEYVTLTMVKPAKFCDDLPANEVLVGRFYIKDEE